MARTSPPYALYSEQNSRYKPQNEDSAVAGVVRNAAGVPVIFAAVADGVSGLAAGRAASGVAVSRFTDELARAKFLSSGELAAQGAEIFRHINAAVRELGGDRGAGTTLTAAVVLGNDFVVFHVGDSSCLYLGQDATGSPWAVKLTLDHTVVAEAAQSGASEETMDALHQHALARCLGDSEVSPQIVLNPPGISLARGQLVLVTDGVSDVWTPGELLNRAGTARSGAEFCRELCVESLLRPTRRGGPNKDNITAALLMPPSTPLTTATGECLFAGGAAKEGAPRPLWTVAQFAWLFVGAAGLILGAITGAALLAPGSSPTAAAPPAVKVPVQPNLIARPESEPARPHATFLPNSPANKKARPASETEPDWDEYVVKQGDTVWALGKRGDFTEEEFKRLNPEIGDDCRIFPDTRVKLPKRRSR